MCCAAVGSNKSQQKGTSFLPSLHLTFFFFQKSKNNLLLGSIKIKTQSSLHPTLLHIAFVNWFNYSRRRKLLQKVMEAEIKWKEQKRKREKINKLEQMFKWRLRIGRYWFIWYVPVSEYLWLKYSSIHYLILTTRVITLCQVPVKRQRDTRLSERLHVRRRHLLSANINLPDESGWVAGRVDVSSWQRIRYCHCH